MKETLQKHQLQYQVQRRENIDTARTNQWLRTQGIDAVILNTTDTLLLQAQQQAYTTLKNFSHYLDQEEQKKLKRFVEKMKNTEWRKKLSRQSAYPILKITRKINRQLFKTYKSINKAK